MGVELPLRVVVTILECCVTFSGVKLSIRSFVLFLGLVRLQVFAIPELCATEAMLSQFVCLDDQ